jgi:site-specific recombinase XerD
MLDHLEQTTAPNSRFGPLEPHVAAFLATLAEAGYARITVEIQLRLLSHLGRWMQRTRRPVTDLCQNTLETFLTAYRRRIRLKEGDRCTLRRFIEHLQHRGVIAVPNVEPESKLPIMKIERRYEDHLLKERGLTAATVERYIWFVHRFLLHCFHEGPLTLKRLKAADILNFVVNNAHCTGPKRAQLMVTAIRSFFRFLTREGEIQIGLAGIIPSVPCRTLVGVPKYISESDVERVLESCDRGTAIGRRDYAILLLLARLGLRAGEVARLQLGDINWRSGEICVLGKGQVRDRLPLLSDVGEALGAYLRGDRPSSPSRNVFLRLKAPRGPFCRSIAVSSAVKRALSRAGLQPPHQGAHLLRHSLATSLLRKRASMAEIAELLRHRSPATTEIYAKVDSQSLRALAQPWPTMRGER